MNRLMVPPKILQSTTTDVLSKQSHHSYRKHHDTYTSQHQTEFMPSSINTQTDNSSAFTTLTSNNIQYPIATANGISKLLQLDLNKINHQHNPSQETDTLMITNHSPAFPPTITPTISTLSIPETQHINKKN